MTRREALYAQLGLIDRPLPNYSCGGCELCASFSVSADSMAQARREPTVTLEQGEMYARVRLVAERSKLPKGKLVDDPGNLLEWKRHA